MFIKKQALFLLIMLIFSSILIFLSFFLIWSKIYPENLGFFSTISFHLLMIPFVVFPFSSSYILLCLLKVKICVMLLNNSHNCYVPQKRRQMLCPLIMETITVLVNNGDVLLVKNSLLSLVKSSLLLIVFWDVRPKAC